MKVWFMLLLLGSLTGCAALPSDYTSAVFASGLQNPRGLVCDEAGGLLVTERGKRAVTRLWRNGTRETLVSGLDTSIHGIALFGSHLYVSDSATVKRWPYVAGSREPITAAGAPVVTGMPTDGHITRTLVFG